MNHLVIDIGNSFSKVALFNNRNLTQLHSTRNLHPDFIRNIVSGFKIDTAIMSAVKEEAGIEDYLRSHFNYLRFSASLSSLINNHYKSPKTLGLDRYAAVIGAAFRFSDKDCLVIDAGSCITYDFIDRNKNYYGGSISPGIDMRFKSMHHFTGKLPFVNFDTHFEAESGSDTSTSMLSGVQNGVVYEVKGFIESYRTKYPDLIIALCGGNTDFFDRQLKNSIFAPSVKAIPDLVLIGLNEVIHHYND